MEQKPRFVVCKAGSKVGKYVKTDAAFRRRKDAFDYVAMHQHYTPGIKLYVYDEEKKQMFEVNNL